MSRLLSSLPAGALVKDPDSKYYGKTVIFRILEHGHSGDPTGSTTIMADKIIAIKAFDAKEASNSDSNRRSYGNNRCSYSNLLRWLNSDVAAGGWYAAMHSADAAPSSGNVSYNPYDSEAGFLNGFSENMKNALMSVVKRTAKNTVTDGGSYEDVASKVFLLSKTEVGLGNENGVAEGTQYSYFNSNSARIAYPTAEAVSNSNYTDSSLASSKAWYYWLRTPNASNSYDVRIVKSDGTLNYSNAYNGNNGVRPACSISSSILVSDEADSDGAYTLIFNSAPDITPDSKDYGDRSAAFSIAIQADDSDGDTFDLQIKIDESVKTTAHTTGSITYALNLEEYWPELDKGAHTITVTATDSQGTATTKAYTFNKTNSCADAPEITNAEEGQRKDTEFYVEIQAGADPDGDTQVITVQASTDAEFKEVKTYSGMQIMNNGAWEDIQTISNEDIGKKIRVKVSGRTDGEKIYIRAVSNDSGSGQASYSTPVFVKIGTVLEIITKPMIRSTKPELVDLKLKCRIPDDAEMHVYVSNNASDDEPTWEEYQIDEYHSFTNNEKTSEQWAVAAKIVVNANESTEEISVEAIGIGVL